MIVSISLISSWLVASPRVIASASSAHAVHHSVSGLERLPVTSGTLRQHSALPTSRSPRATCWHIVSIARDPGELSSLSRMTLRCSSALVLVCRASTAYSLEHPKASIAPASEELEVPQVSLNSCMLRIVRTPMNARHLSISRGSAPRRHQGWSPAFPSSSDQFLRKPRGDRQNGAEASKHRSLHMMKVASRHQLRTA